MQVLDLRFRGVTTALAIASPLAAVALALALLQVRRGSTRTAAIVLPVAAGLAVAVAVRRDFTLLAAPLFAMLLVGAVALAYRCGDRLSWAGVATFAAGGVVFGYGQLDRLLCSAAQTCSGSRPGAVAAVGGAVALGAYAFLFARGVVRR
jgi:hypothetical protein